MIQKLIRVYFGDGNIVEEPSAIKEYIESGYRITQISSGEKYYCYILLQKNEDKDLIINN